MSHTFSPELARMVEERLSAGEYASADALLIDALHALDDLEARREELRSSIAARRAKAGQGLGTPLDLEQFFQAARDRRNQQQ